MTIDSELSYIVTISPSIEGSYDLEVSASNSGSLAGTIGSPTDTENITLGSQNEITALALDPQAGIYFVAEALNPGTDGQPTNLEIFRETLGSAVTSLSNPVATASFTTGGMIEANIQAIGVDAPDDTLYYTGGNKLLDASFSGANFTGTETTRTLATVPLPHATSNAIAGIYAFALDQPNHAAYLAVATNTGSSTPDGGVLGGLAGNYIYKVTGLTSGATAGTISSTISVPFNDGQVTGIAVDSANEEVFFVTEPASGGTENTSGLYRLSGTSITPIWTESTTGSVSSLPVAPLVGLVIDPATGDYYATSSKGIYEGNITLATAPTLVVANTNVASRALAIDDGPSVAAVSVLAIDGSTSHTTGELYTGDTLTLAVTFSEPVIVSGAPTITLNDGGAATYSSGAGSNVLDFVYAPASGQNTGTLAATGDSGTITGEDNAPLGGSITGTFTSLGVDTTPPTLTLTGTATEPLQGGGSISPITNVVIGDPEGTGLLTGALVTLVGSASGDVFGITGALSGSTDGGTISYSETAGVLTLSGTAGLAAYEAALEAITYQDGASQATPHPARTFAVTVEEVSLTSTLSTDIITIDHTPVAASGGFAAALAAGASLSGTNLLAGDTDTDNDTLAITSISGAGGTIVAGTTLAGTYGVISINSTGAYSYTASNSAAIGAAPAGSLPADDFNITISDGHGGLTTESVAFNIARAPTVAAGATVTAYQTYAMAIDPTAAVNDPDGADITAATVSIASGFEAGDVLSLASGITANYNAGTGELDLSGTASAAAYQAAIDNIVFSAASYDPSDTTRIIDYSVTAVDSGITVVSGTDTSEITISGGGTYTVSGNGTDYSATVQSGGTILAISGGVLSGATILSGGTALVSVGGTAAGLDVQAGGTEIVVSGGALYDVTISGGSVDLLSGAASSGTIAFAGSGGSLVVSGAFPGGDTLAGFSSGTGDNIVFDGVSFVSGATATLSGGVILVATGGTDFTINDPTAAQGTPFTIADDNGTAEIIPCFVTNTRILTTEGYLPVQNLCVGDRVVTVRPGGPESAEITWLGQRTVNCEALPTPEIAWPILVCRGALGPAMPARDLWVSPDHCLMLDDVLIPAKVLVNGDTIRQVPRDRVTYWHVELTAHDVMLAEGMPAESFLDTGNRAAFSTEAAGNDAGDAPTKVHHWTDTCLPMAFGPDARRHLDAHLARHAEAFARA